MRPIDDPSLHERTDAGEQEAAFRLLRGHLGPGVAPLSAVLQCPTEDRHCHVADFVLCIQYSWRNLHQPAPHAQIKCVPGSATLGAEKHEGAVSIERPSLDRRIRCEQYSIVAQDDSLFLPINSLCISQLMKKHSSVIRISELLF